MRGVEVPLIVCLWLDGLSSTVLHGFGIKTLQRVGPLSTVIAYMYIGVVDIDGEVRAFRSQRRA